MFYVHKIFPLSINTTKNNNFNGILKIDFDEICMRFSKIRDICKDNGLTQ